jgi:uncharacterized membrane protein
MKAAGFSLVSGRAFSILLGLAAIPVLFLLAREMAGEQAAWFACGLFALAPFQAQLAMQVRMYTGRWFRKTAHRCRELLFYCSLHTPL